MHSHQRILTKEALYLGIDGGGSKCKVRLEDSSGLVLAEATSGPANIATSAEQTQQSIYDAAVCALMYADIPISKLSSIHAYAGLAGANVPSALSKIRQWQHPFATLEITTDMHIACAGAHQGKQGAVIIIGTGFCAGAIKDDKVCEFGGHGLLLSDGASGAWLGLNLVRHTLEVLDGLAEPCALSDALLHYTQCQSSAELTAKCLDAKPRYFAQFAPLLFSHAHSPTGSRLLASAAQYVAKYVRYLQQLGYTEVCLMGGIANTLTPWLDNHARQCLVDVKGSPEEGAMYLLHRLGERG